MSGVCFLCIHGEAWPEVSETDTIPLCNSHWSRWVVRFVNSDDLPPCGARLMDAA